MASPGCSGPIFLVLSLGVVGRDTVSTSDGGRAVVYAEDRTRSRYRFLSMPGLGWRRRRDVRLNDACGGSKQQLGPHQWPGRCLTLRAQAQWLSNVNPNLLGSEVEVCAKALQQRTRLNKHCLMPGSRSRAYFGIASMGR
jgi:hypothetical protein